MQNADTLVPAFNGHPDELFERALKPRRHHDAIVMPDRAKFVPESCIAPYRPVFNQLANSQLLCHFMCHFNAWYLFKFNFFILDDFFQIADVSFNSHFEFIRRTGIG